MLCRAHFGHDELHGKSRADLHDMLHAIGINWTTGLDERCRNGTFLISAEGGIDTRSDVLPTCASIAQAVGVSCALAP